MEVAVPAPARHVEFNFDSACSSPYMTAPSSPQRFGNFFFSAPTTPSRAAAFYSPASDSGDGEFEFDFSEQLERVSLSAEELFDCGKIRQLKPPPGYRVTDSVPSNVSSPRSPASSKMSQQQEKRKVQDNFDPFEEALMAARKEAELPLIKPDATAGEKLRGRERSAASLRSPENFKRSGSRSLSPIRVSNIILNPETASKSTDRKDSVSSSSFLSSFSLPKGSRKWRIRDLFRSASEGRATEKEVKNSSFGSMESVDSRRRKTISAHEMHYRTKRAVSEELRKKTTLPYKHGLLGCLGFNSTMHSSISRGFGSLTRG